MQEFPAAQQLSPDVVYHPPLRRGQHKWDGWYDVPAGQRFRCAPSCGCRPAKGFDDPELACQAAEILAQWDLEGACIHPRPLKRVCASRSAVAWRLR